ncbi:hypothetical protein WBG78_29060 [Chryseolinea sp. T2]|uniref:hypothetical protein n=1 Tax=Chryseolinea sp. T2 TaxID=3129255 RepID=UPI0030780520
MAHYVVNSTNSRDFSLSKNNVVAGNLKYSKWYSFDAEIALANRSVYVLEPKGFWNSKIELKKDDEPILYFEMGWKGIVIHFNDGERKYLLRLAGLLSSKYVLVDTDENELLAVKTDFKWSKMTLDFNIETSREFDRLENGEVFLLTLIHCINYYMASVNGAI